MTDQPVPLNCAGWRLAPLAGGFDRDRGCFVAISEVPEGPLVREGGLLLRGGIVLQGSVDLPNGLYMASPILAAQLEGVAPEQVVDLLWLARAPEGPKFGFRHIGNWPPSHHDWLADLEVRGLVERKPLPKSAVRKRPWARVRSQPTYWRITPAGRAWLAENHTEGSVT